LGINRVAEAFSGGVDSTPLAATCHHYLRKQSTLVTVGFSRSHDIIFSKWATSKMGIDHKVYEMNRSDFEENLQRIHELIKCKNTSHIENCIAYF
jgi:asparagine synthase (glutamine-hydrolysing)